VAIMLSHVSYMLNVMFNGKLRLLLSNTQHETSIQSQYYCEPTDSITAAE